MVQRRTIGLPFVPTVGACTGRVVALASPRATRVPFNWARVLTHEVTHVITLQQTEFNIPHWYTEALAVESEGFPRPQEWNKMLLVRVPTRKLLNLDTINLGFIRPKEPEDRQLAYCQAQLYAHYMLKRFGDDALIKLLMAYRRGRTTDRAITECFHVEKADFEKGYLSFLDEVVKTIRTRVNEEQPVKFSQLERQLKEKPEDPDLNARMAYEYFARRSYSEARPFADKALELKPHHPLASYVKARLLQSIGENEGALAALEAAHDPKKPNERVIDLLAELKMKAGQLDEAEKLYELARKDDPYHSKWIAGLAASTSARSARTPCSTTWRCSPPMTPTTSRCARLWPNATWRRDTPPPPPNGPMSAFTSTSTIRPCMSCWPTPRPPAISSPTPSRNMTPPWS